MGFTSLIPSFLFYFIYLYSYGIMKVDLITQMEIKMNKNIKVEEKTEINDEQINITKKYINKIYKALGTIFVFIIIVRIFCYCN